MLFGKPIYYRFYPFDRIRGTVSLTVDGEKMTLTRDDIVFYDKKYDKYEDGSAKDISDGRVKIYMDGSEYGSHCFEVHSDKLKEPVAVSCFQDNWWNVVDFDLDIAVNGGYMSCSGEYSTNRAFKKTKINITNSTASKISFGLG